MLRTDIAEDALAKLKATLLEVLEVSILSCIHPEHWPADDGRDAVVPFPAQIANLTHLASEQRRGGTISSAPLIPCYISSISPGRQVPSNHGSKGL